jgi:DNA-binding protein
METKIVEKPKNVLPEGTVAIGQKDTNLYLSAISRLIIHKYLDKNKSITVLARGNNISKMLNVVNMSINLYNLKILSLDLSQEMINSTNVFVAKVELSK